MTELQSIEKRSKVNYFQVLEIGMINLWLELLLLQSKIDLQQ